MKSWRAVVENEPRTDGRTTPAESTSVTTNSLHFARLLRSLREWKTNLNLYSFFFAPKMKTHFCWLPIVYNIDWINLVFNFLRSEGTLIISCTDSSKSLRTKHTLLPRIYIHTYIQSQKFKVGLASSGSGRRPQQGIWHCWTQNGRSRSRFDRPLPMLRSTVGFWGRCCSDASRWNRYIIYI